MHPHFLQLQDLYAKKKEPDLLCPECRSPCPAPFESLPTNVILNRILDGMAGPKGAGHGERHSGQSRSGSFFFA